MSISKQPRFYLQWRDGVSREEDAAALFGHYLIQHCRQTALQTAGFGASAEARGAGEDAVDLALHGVMHLLEGYWKLPAGDGFSLQLELRVNVFRGLEKVESVALSPGRLDLPVGYWTWVEEVE